MSLLSVAERLSEPLDWCRRGWFSWLVQSDVVRATLAHRDRRITTVACASVLLAALGAVYFPVLLFTLGPVVLGVAHVAADVRYLVLRRNLARWWQNSVWLGCTALIGLRVLEELGLLRHADRLEFGVAAGFATVAVCAGLRERGSRKRALLAGAVLAFATTYAIFQPRTARYVFLHAHNVIALLAWATLFRSNKRWLLAPAALIAGSVVVLASGALAKQTLASPFAASFHLHVFTVSDWLAPFADPRLAIGVTTTYLFLQSVHYSAWLSWIPQEEQPRGGTLTFRMSLRSLFSDLGTKGVAAVGIAAGAVLVGACFDLHRAQGLYLSLATFHGYLELALLAFFWVRAKNGAPHGSEAPVSLAFLSLLMPPLLCAWLTAFAITAASELLIAVPLLAPGGSRLRRAAAVSLAQLATHPSVWFIWPLLALPRPLFLLLAESFAVLLEALIYRFSFERLSWSRCLAASAIANSASVFVGLWLR